MSKNDESNLQHSSSCDQDNTQTTEHDKPTVGHSLKIFPPKKNNETKIQSNIKKTSTAHRFSPYVITSRDPQSKLCQNASADNLKSSNQTAHFLQNNDDEILRKSFSVPNQLSQNMETTTGLRTFSVASNTMNSLAILRLAKLAELSKRSGLMKETTESDQEKDQNVRNISNSDSVNKLLRQVNIKNWIGNIRTNAALAHANYRAKLIMSQTQKSSSRELKISNELTKRQISVRHSILPTLKAQGFCVLDNFMGKVQATKLQHCIENLYESGVCQNGKLLGKGPNTNAVRGDKIAWLAGNETGSEAISSFMKFTDTIVCSGCGLIPNDYRINGGTKAMVACYPGKGEHYKLHVDNPLKDGRCLTCIYYTNEDWDSTTMGGNLRMHAQTSGRTAEIAPKFDRVVFFYSDRRNPHEVLPAFNKRMAITLWYFDYEERQRALAKRALKPQEKPN